MDLDALSSDDAEESMKPRDISVTLLCGSEDGHTHVNSDQVLSDEDLPTAAGSRDQRQVFRTHDLSPVEWYSRRIVQMSGCRILLAFRHRLRKPGRKPTTRDFSRRSLPGGRTSRSAGGGTGGDHPTLFASEVGTAVP